MENVTFDAVTLARIAVAVALGFVIGWEREYRGSPAGGRTFSLIALGTAAFTAVGVENFPATAEKIMAGIATGLGFLGGGMIMRESGAVRGLTSAAAIWATAAVGILAGVGELLTAAVVTAMMVIILEVDRIPGLRRIAGEQMKPQPNDRTA